MNDVEVAVGCVPNRPPLRAARSLCKAEYLAADEHAYLCVLCGPMGMRALIGLEDQR